MSQISPLAFRLLAASLLVGCVDAPPAPGPTAVVLGPSPVDVGWDPTWHTVIDPSFAAVRTWDPGWGDDMRPGGPAAVARLGGVNMYFYRTAANQLAVYQDDARGFYGAFDSNLLAPPAAVAHDGVVDVVFVAGGASNPYLYRRRWNGSAFVSMGTTDLELIATHVVADTPAIAATAVTTLTRWRRITLTQLDVFFLRKGGEPRHYDKLGDGTWQYDPEFYPDAPLLATPSAVSPQRNRLDVAYTTASGVVRHVYADYNSYCGTACWSVPEDVMTGAVSGATITGYGTALDVFAVVGGSDQSGATSTHLLQSTRGASGAWGAPAAVADCTHATPADMIEAAGLGERYSAASAVSSAGRINLVVWGLDTNLWADAWGFGVYTGPVVTPPCGLCARAGDPCCSKTCTDPGLACDAADRCEACGGDGQLCCAGDTCGAGFSCNPKTDTCECGGRDEVCCGGACSGGLTCGSDHVCGGSFTPVFDLLKTSCTSSCHAHRWDAAVATSASDPTGSESNARLSLFSDPPLVVTYSPGTSPLYARVISSSPIIPLGMAPYLPDPAADQKLISDWIRSGAPL